MEFCDLKRQYHFLKKEIDVMKCKESLWEWFFGYKQFNIKHDNMRIDCVVTCPDDYPHEIIRDIETIGSAARDSIKHIEFNIDIHSYLPIKNHITTPLIANSQNKADIKGRIVSLNKKEEKNFLGNYKK